MKTVCLLIGIFICHSLSAQLNNDSLRMQYKTKTLLIQNGLTMDGYRIDKMHAQNLMLISPEATGYYKLYLKNSRPATILPFIGLAASLTGLFINGNNSRTTRIVLVLSGGVISSTGSIFRGSATRHLQNAVWTYNRDVLYPVK